MRSPFRSRGSRVMVAGLVATALIIGSTAFAVAKPPPKPKPTPSPTSTPTPTPTPVASPSVTVEIAPTGTLEPSGEYANVDVTVTCPVGWTWSYGRLYVLQGDRGGSGTFSATCTGTAQAARSRVVNGNRFTLGNWTATAYVGIVRNGHEATATSSRTISLEPGVVARIANQAQLTGTAGGGLSLAVAVACPIGAAGAASSLTVTQGTALGQASFTPTCDRFSHTLVISIGASQGTFHTGSADASTSAKVTWTGGTFSGTDSRTITILESSTGDTMPPSTPPGLSAQVFSTSDGETELQWGTSTDNATPTGLLTYEIFLNGRFDQPICCGMTKAILYSDVGVLNTIEVVAVDGADNRSAPASVTVDLRQ